VTHAPFSKSRRFFILGEQKLSVSFFVLPVVAPSNVTFLKTSLLALQIKLICHLFIKSTNVHVS
jgi:hypothetical protein